jgi:hypothetical protein
MQVAEGGLAHISGFAVFRRILRSDGIPDIFGGFGTSTVGALPKRVIVVSMKFLYIYLSVRNKAWLAALGIFSSYR